MLGLFGLSVEAIWSPLGSNSDVVRGSKSCGTDCDAWNCKFDDHCLTSLLPEMVIESVKLHADTRVETR